METLEKLTPEQNKEFDSWEKELTTAVKTKGGFPLEKSHLLQHPACIRLGMLGKSLDSHPFSFWSEGSVINFKGTKYLRMKKLNKKTVNEKPLPILRSYRDSQGHDTKKGEIHSFTLLFEKPNEHRVCSKECVVDWTGSTYFATPVILSDEGDIAKFRGNSISQQNLTPLGKKGVIAFHTKQQYSILDEAAMGYGIQEEFQRFFMAPTPESAVVRAAHTIRKLAGADPKTTNKGAEGLVELFRKKLTNLGQSFLHNTNYVKETEFVNNLKTTIQGFSNEPVLTIDLDEEETAKVSLCADLANGYTYQSCAVSLRFHHQLTQDEIQKIWQNLIK
jgi:hypothetical protein